MKTRLKEFKYRLTALWWFLTRRYYYMLYFNGKTGEVNDTRVLETYNINISDLVEYIKTHHGMMTKTDLVWKLKDIASCLAKPRDILAYDMIKDLIDELKKEEADDRHEYTENR